MSGSQRSAAGWVREQERSNLVILRVMVWISLRLGRRVGRMVLHGIALYYVLFAPRARAASRIYLERVLGRRVRWLDGYRHVLSFASTIHDRIYLLNDRFDLFDLDIRGTDDVDAVLAHGRGVLLIGAHLGSFEVLRAVARDRADLRLAILMYEDNARKINATLQAVNPSVLDEIIPLGRIGSMLRVRESLDAGYLVGLLADRDLGAQASARYAFLGQPADFPLGPFRLAATLRRPVFFMAGLYLGGNRYQLRFEPLADFSDLSPDRREAAIHEAQGRYVARLAEYCHRAPYNWFNFFDFWQSAR